MKEKTPKEIVLVASLITSLFISALLTVLFIMDLEETIWLMILIIGLSVFLTTYFLFRYSLEKFIYSKIKLIYKSIHDLKTKSNPNIKPVNINQDTIGEVNQEVLRWAKDKKEEIRLLREQEAFRREFIGNLSHELKTPLFNIQGYVHTLMEGGLEDKKINWDYLSRTDKNIERLIHLLSDLDIVTRLESEEAKPQPKRIDIVELASEVFQSFEIKAKEKQIRLKFNREYNKPVWVVADKNKIHQVLTNLVANSINYGKEKGETEVRFYDMDPHILVEVADNGIGIEKEHMSRLFERFYRIDKSRARHQGGSGLGLAIVKHIIDAHNQTINVRSTSGEGSTFSFTLEKAR